MRAVAVDNTEAPGVDERAAELSMLRNEIVAQARELAVIRWEISSLIRQHPVSARVTQAKYSVLRRFPDYAEKISKARRALRDLLAPSRRAPGMAPASAGISGAGNLGSLRGPVLVVGDNTVAEQALRATGTQDVVVLDPGAGLTRSLPVPQADETAVASAR